MSKLDDEELEFLGPYDPIPEPLLADWIFRLQEGETGPEADGIARQIILDFCLCVWNGGQPQRATLEWLAEVLSEIRDYGSPDARAAFSLLPERRGHKAETGKHLNIRIWIELSMRRGYTEPEAKKLAAETFHLAVPAIRKIWRHTQHWELDLPDEKVLSEKYKQMKRPLPAPKMQP